MNPWTRLIQNRHSSTLSRYALTDLIQLDWSCFSFIFSHQTCGHLQISRNRLGLNDVAHEKAKEEARKERERAEKKRVGKKKSDAP